MLGTLLAGGLLTSFRILGDCWDGSGEKVEDSKEEDPVWLLSENSNLVGGKIVSLSGGEGEWRVQGLQKNTCDPK